MVTGERLPDFTADYDVNIKKFASGLFMRKLTCKCKCIRNAKMKHILLNSIWYVKRYGEAK